MEYEKKKKREKKKKKVKGYLAHLCAQLFSIGNKFRFAVFVGSFSKKEKKRKHVNLICNFTIIFALQRSCLWSLTKQVDLVLLFEINAALQVFVELVRNVLRKGGVERRVNL